MGGVVVAMSGGEECAGGTEDMEREAGQEAKDKGKVVGAYPRF